MPVIWQSSKQPMYVRTVWVDGFRHAILNTDDPYFQILKAKRRPQSSISYRQHRNCDSRLSKEFEGLRKLNLVVTSDKSIHPRPNTAQPSVERLDLKDIEQETENKFVLRPRTAQLNEFESARPKYDSFIDMKTLKSNRTCRTEVKESTELSDRVLQWLDLAGKVDLLAPENDATRMAQPRHSWPDVQKRNHLTKSKTAVDVRKDSAKESPKEMANVLYERGDIDRQEFYVPAAANTIETYARLSRADRATPRDARKPRDYVKTKTRDLRRNVQETRQKIASERNAVEKQYADLVSRKILPDFGKPKKQVHIFIPEAVNKKTDSLISQTS
ncbi:uncharacterized protein LOC125488849 [Plutella xylostella]|uniref:uncharacterized protein LOC125488849 n=1 Tax=Plutella xylostella TaxID=51655 RepID=UPI002032A726|nr:uncharacterized protein LOC125488849 [Plutella xylostella]